MSRTDQLPDGVLVSWYGDDFTGSSGVLEVLSFAGLPSVLFLDVPTEAQLAAFRHCRGIGIAGIARSKNPEWMEENLPRYFRALARIGAPIAQYKICSTLDSAPHIGSIGKATDLGAPVLGGLWHPLIVAAPPIRRYQAFGNLFAGLGEKTYRLDRHPTMSRHPVTPMDEADVRVHLSRQTNKYFGLVDLLGLRAGRGSEVLREELARGAEIVAIDVIDDADLVEAGRLIWENRGDKLFAIASQGLQYALVAFWQAAGLILAEPPPDVGPAERMAVVSGSCAPQTAKQIHWASEHGFAAIPLDAARVMDERAFEAELDRAAQEALAAIGNGRDPIVYTALGPDDPAVAAFNAAAATAAVPVAELNIRVGSGLGRLFDRICRTVRLRRGVIAGGDTSGYASSVLSIYAFEALAPIVSGAPLMKAHSEDAAYRDLEIALKGGQMGPPDYFSLVKQGGRKSTPLAA